MQGQQGITSVHDPTCIGATTVPQRVIKQHVALPKLAAGVGVSTGSVATAASRDVVAEDREAGVPEGPPTIAKSALSTSVGVFAEAAVPQMPPPPAGGPATPAKPTEAPGNRAWGVEPEAQTPNFDTFD